MAADFIEIVAEAGADADSSVAVVDELERDLLQLFDGEHRSALGEVDELRAAIAEAAKEEGGADVEDLFGPDEDEPGEGDGPAGAEPRAGDDEPAVDLLDKIAEVSHACGLRLDESMYSQ